MSLQHVQLKEVTKLKKITSVSIALMCLIVFSVAYSIATSPLPSPDEAQNSPQPADPLDNGRPYSPLPIKPIDNGRPY